MTGSPAYLAPEVAAGQRGDEAVDVWSLGATLFHVLSGRPPYDMGDNVLGGLYRIVNEEPPRLADAGWLAPLLEATMVKDPAQRWSMAQVRDFLAGRPPAPVAAAAEPGRRRCDPAEPDARRRADPVLGAVEPALRRPRRSADGAVLLRRPARTWIASSGSPWRWCWRWCCSPSSPTASAAAGQPAAATRRPARRPRQPSDPEPEQDRPAPPAAKPTARGMESFIRDYVAAVSHGPRHGLADADPEVPARERRAGHLPEVLGRRSARGRILDISADPRSLVVSYRVRFDNFGTGRRPTVLDLVFDDGRYRIDGERTQGFVPAG